MHWKRNINSGPHEAAGARELSARLSFRNQFSLPLTWCMVVRHFLPIRSCIAFCYASLWTCNLFSESALTLVHRSFTWMAFSQCQDDFKTKTGAVQVDVYILKHATSNEDSRYLTIDRWYLRCLYNQHLHINIFDLGNTCNTAYCLKNPLQKSLYIKQLLLLLIKESS